jgi:hypothetical protein
MMSAGDPPAASGWMEGECRLVITRVAKHPAVALPSDPIPDAAFQPAEDEPPRRLVFSEKGRKVAIEGHEVAGVLEEGKPGERVYRLEEGLGGKHGVATELRLRLTDRGITAQLTHFGSGVPVTASFRGRLEK